MLFLRPSLHSSTVSSSTRFMKGSNPRRMPLTARPPFNFSDIFLSMNLRGESIPYILHRSSQPSMRNTHFFSSGGCAFDMFARAIRSRRRVQCCRERKTNARPKQLIYRLGVSNRINNAKKYSFLSVTPFVTQSVQIDLGECRIIELHNAFLLTLPLANFIDTLYPRFRFDETHT